MDQIHQVLHLMSGVDISVHNVSLWLRLLSAHYNLPSNLNGFRHVTPKLDPASDPPDQDVPIRLTQLAHPVQCYLMPTCNLRLIPLSLLLPRFYYFLCTLNVSSTGWVFNRGGFSSYLQFTAFISSPVDSNSQYCQPEFGSTGTYFLSPAEMLHLRFRENSGGPSTDVHSLRQYHPWHLSDSWVGVHVQCLSWLWFQHLYTNIVMEKEYFQTFDMVILISWYNHEISLLK